MTLLFTNKTVFKSLCLAIALIVFLTLSANAASIYVSGSNGDIYTVDIASGLATFVTDTPIMSDIALDSNGDLWGLGFHDSSLYQIDTSVASSSSTLVGASGITGANALVFGPDGTLYAAGTSTTFRYLYRLNTSTGGGTNIGSNRAALISPSSGDLEFDDVGNLYLTGDSGSPDSLIRINEETGAATALVGGYGATGYDYLHGLAYVNGVMYGFSGLDIITLDLTSGASTYFKTITTADGSDVPFASVYGAATFPHALKGDLNGDDLVNLADVVKGHQVVAGLNPVVIRDDYAASGTDVNGNQKIGLEEAIYILQENAGIRLKD